MRVLSLHDADLGKSSVAEVRKAALHVVEKALLYFKERTEYWRRYNHEVSDESIQFLRADAEVLKFLEELLVACIDASFGGHSETDFCQEPILAIFSAHPPRRGKDCNLRRWIGDDGYAVLANWRWSISHQFAVELT